LRPDDAPLPTLVFDFNADGAVDVLNDLNVFAACATGPGIPRTDTAACRRSDYDSDNDVDAADFAAFQRCLMPADMAPVAGCLR
jgi:hypothetical protein